MALKISTIRHKPGLLWRGPVSDQPWGWGGLVRALQADFLVGIETDQELATAPNDLRGLIGRQPAEPAVTIDLHGPGAASVPQHGHWLHVPAWEFSTLPEAWLVPVINGSDLVYVASEAQRQGFAADAVPTGQLAVLTPGVDLAVMSPEGPVHVPAGAKERRIVFIGDLSWSSGIDILLAAYGAEFLADDPVTLIVLDTDQADADNRAAALAELAALQADPEAPHLLHLPMPADANERAALLRGCEMLVYLSRSVGHPWPVVEAMACGVPVAVPNEGPGAAVVPADAGWQLSTGAIRHDSKAIGHVPTLGHALFHQVQADALRRRLRGLIEQPDEIPAKRTAARAAAGVFSWQQVAAHFKAGFDTIKDRPSRRQRTWELQAIYGQAKEAFSQDDHTTVRQLLEPFADTEVASPEFYALYGSALLFTGSPGNAIEYLKRAAEQNKNNANYFNLIGIALYHCGEYPLARRFLKVALKLQPSHQGAQESLVSVERQLKGKSVKYRELIGQAHQHLVPLVDHWEKVDRKPVRLSVSMIVKNEEKFLAQCLASIKDVADEIVVVDTGSTDRTVEIAESFGAKIDHFDWTGDFSEARNVSLDLCTGDWVLALDADEELVPESQDILRTLIERPDDKLHLYLPKIINLVDGSDIDGIEHFAPRLFPRHPQIRWVGRIHEQILHQQGHNAMERARVPAVVLRHYGYDPSLVAERGKNERNRALLEQALHEYPDEPFHHFNFGVALRVEDKVNEAIPYFRKAIDLCHAKGLTPMYLAAAYSYLIASLVTVERIQEALDLAATCEMYCHDQPDYWLNLAIAHDKLDHHHDAIQAFQRCLDLRSSTAPLVADRGAMTWKPYAGIGSAYLKLGEIEKGERYLRMALKENPHNLDVRRVFVRLAIARQDHELAEKELRGMLGEAKGPERRTTYQDLANLYLQLKRHDDAVATLTDAKARAEGETELAGAVSDLARILQIVGRDADALALMEGHQLSAGVFEELSNIYGREQDWDALIGLCDKLLANEIGMAYAHAQRAIALLHKGDRTAAETDLRAALDLDPTDANSWSNLGVIALGREAIDEAEGFYKQALVHEPAAFSANLDLGKIALYRQQPQEAYPYLQAALKAIPNDPTALALAAEAATALDDQDAAEGHLHDLIDAEPTESGHWVQLGYHYLNRGEATAAMRVLGEALEMTKNAPNPAVYSALGVTLLELGKMEDARNAFILAVHLSPDDPQAMQGLQLADRLCGVS